MYFPQLQQTPEQVRQIGIFGGLDFRGNVPEGSFAQMENLCSDNFPLTCVRPPRRLITTTENVGGMTIRDGLCYADGGDFMLNGARIPMGLTPGEKTLVAMGVYVIILPDKKYINTLDWSDRGALEVTSRPETTVQILPCRLDGSGFSSLYASRTPPLNPEDGEYWMDLSQTPPVLKYYVQAQDSWEQDTDCATLLLAPGIGKGFSQGDGVTLEGITVPEAERLNTTTVLLLAEEDQLVIPGLVESCQQTPEQGYITVSRKMPELDFVFEAGNRLWGCRYGSNGAGQTVNEIYASKLGDFKNWNCFRGLSTDSYRVSLGADGRFTGAVNYMGSPLFFRESCLHKLHGSYPAEYRVQTTGCHGVAKGSHRSLAVVDGVLYYLSNYGVCGYDGSLPALVSQCWGQKRFSDGVAGPCGSKYYISVLDEEQAAHLLVYDTARGLWHREDDFRAVTFCAWGNRLIGYDGRGIYNMLAEPDPQSPVDWMAQTGQLYSADHDTRYISRLSAKLTMTPGSVVRFYARYGDGDTWEFLGSVLSQKNGIVRLPFRTRRCESLELRLEGRGQVRLHSLALTGQKGSDR